ncbi:hypothetical protein [Pedobacter punctiformis]|uniref:Uncharacterized protein n=1 Tax=Pedobacter punctiformis TaxID=3004097 RepID=A0ABT4LAQ5_9SPHI|nr:hypothetical protein [Pedobacter sp. HCMS5-2]MCZ4244990.1 hypothetical protein [Pedobacter sp. HCMS5-2]
MSSQDTTNVMDDLKLRFGTNSNEIDANTLITSILHFSNVIQEVNKELKTDRKIDVKIKAFEHGSFIVSIVLESNLLETIGKLFTKDNSDIAANIVSIVGAAYGTYKFLGGSPPTEIKENKEEINLKNINGDNIVISKVVFNVVNNPQVQNSVSKGLQVLENDSDVQSFEIFDKKNDKVVGLDDTDIHTLANMEISNRPDTRVISRECILNIISLSFDKSKNWEFYLDGNKITAKIKDTVFHEHIDKGESFAKGDTLYAELEVSQVYNYDYNAYANKSYRVIKIIKHTNRPKQTDIFNED